MNEKINKSQNDGGKTNKKTKWRNTKFNKLAANGEQFILNVAPNGSVRIQVDSNDALTLWQKKTHNVSTRRRSHKSRMKTRTLLLHCDADVREWAIPFEYASIFENCFTFQHQLAYHESGDDLIFYSVFGISYSCTKCTICTRNTYYEIASTFRK